MTQKESPRAARWLRLVPQPGVLRFSGTREDDRNRLLADTAILRRTERAAWVESHLVPSNDGPARKYYRLTADGKQAFSEAHDLWIDLHHSITTLIEEPS